jgi:hypothetical protein
MFKIYEGFGHPSNAIVLRLFIFGLIIDCLYSKSSIVASKLLLQIL